jgi:aminoglycoside phosphotransferase (APT) family kinase protein
LVDREFVIKVEKNHKWLENMRREPEVLKKLFNYSEVEVPELVDSGNLNDLDYRVIDFVEGETLDQYSDGRNFYNLSLKKRKDFAEMMGETLAKVHEYRELGSCGVLNADDEGFVGSSSSWDSGILDLQEWWHERLKDEGFERIVERSEQVFKQNSELLDENNDFRLLHMEFDLRNLLFQENEIVVLDWEVAALGDPRLDIVMTEKRLIWRESEDEEVKEAFREGYSSVREFELPADLEKLYEIFQMVRFLLIFRKDDEMKNRILDRLDDLFELVGV